MEYKKITSQGKYSSKISISQKELNQNGFENGEIVKVIYKDNKIIIEKLGGQNESKSKFE